MPDALCFFRRETHCEFCDSTLPEWKSTLTPVCGANAPAVMNVNFDGQTYSFEVKPGSAGYKQFTQAIREAFSLPEDSELNITFTCDEPSQGTLVKHLGPRARLGYACVLLSGILFPSFLSPDLLQKAFSGARLLIRKYLCEQLLLPAGLIHAGSLLTLQGAGAYDAAVHCASVSAARRILQQQQNPDGALPQSMHSIQGQRHYDATQPIPVQVPPPGTSTNPASSSGQSSSSVQSASNGVSRSNSSANGNNRSRKRWTGITRRMRTALCEMWTPNSRSNEEQTGPE